MKIVLLIHSLAMGGAERVTSTLANYWARAGHQVVVATMVGAASDHYELDSRVSRVSFLLARKSKSLGDALVSNVARIRAVRRLLLSEKPDAAIGMMTTSANLLALASVGLGVRVIGSERDYPTAIKGSWKARLTQRAFYRNLTCLVAQTEKAADWLRRHTSARRVVVIPNAVILPLPRTEPTCDPRMVFSEPSIKLIISVSRLVEQKRVDRVIAAFSSVHLKNPDWRLAIIGEGPLRPDLEGIVADHGVADKVTFVGRVGNVSDWYARSSIYVLTSDHEGFPNTLLEAMASGLACIAIDCDAGPRDLITHKQNGLLVEAGDKSALAANLEACMSSEPLRRALGDNAILVRDKYGFAQVVQQWESEFYQHVADG